MSRVTLHYCDFSSQVPNHEAHFAIVAQDETTDSAARLELDACVGHVGQMMTALLTAPDKPAKRVACTRLSHVRELPPVAKVEEVVAGKQTCLDCDKRLANLSGHVTSIHGYGSMAEYQEKHGLPVRRHKKVLVSA